MAGRLDPTNGWPELPYEESKDTLDTLHMCLQVIGKIRLALAPMEPQWAQVPLYLSARGLTTSPIPYGDDAFQIDVDLIDHRVIVLTNGGAKRQIALEPRPVADFYGDITDVMDGLGIDVDISVTPSEVPDPIPFPEDTVHASYDPLVAHRLFKALSKIDLILKEYRARFTGKASAVQLFWGTFDLAVILFSGRHADPPPGADVIVRRSADRELICSGFWPGSQTLSEPAFFAYTYPKPDGIEGAEIRPQAAYWSKAAGEFLLPYEDVRRAASPRAALLDFLESTYQAGASVGGWDPELTSG